VTETIPGEGTLSARFVTNHGEMTIELFETMAPNTVGNFVGLATGERSYEDPRGQEPGTPFYDGTIFHRVIQGFMIQAGDPTGTGRGGPGYRFEDEFHPELRHDGPGVLSMANAGPNTNGSQFFITQVATPHLDGRHSVFGRLVEGHETLEAIAATPTGPMDRPVDAVVLERVEIYRSKA